MCRLEVQGARELQFFPGVGRGGVYPGFQVMIKLPMLVLVLQYICMAMKS